MFLSSFNRSGQIRNYFVVVLFLFGFGFLSIVAAVIWLGFINAYTSAGIYSGVIESTGNNFLNAIVLHDYIIVLIMIALVIGVAVTSYRLNTSPVFFVVTLFMGAFLGLISFFFNYLFVRLVSESVFSTAVLLFPRTMIICTNLHWVSLICVVVGSITLYAKRESQESVYVE